MVKADSIVGIFDLDNTSTSKWTKKYLSNATVLKRVVNVSMELPKSFVVCIENRETKVYISQLNSATLQKRLSDYKILKGGFI